MHISSPPIAVLWAGAGRVLHATGAGPQSGPQLADDAAALAAGVGHQPLSPTVAGTCAIAPSCTGTAWSLNNSLTHDQGKMEVQLFAASTLQVKIQANWYRMMRGAVVPCLL